MYTFHFLIRVIASELVYYFLVKAQREDDQLLYRGINMRLMGERGISLRIDAVKVTILNSQGNSIESFVLPIQNKIT